MKSIFTLSFAALLLTLSVQACSSAGKVGESCSDVGKTDGVCESGAVCSKNNAGTTLCLKICSAQSDCAATEDCNGVEGSSLKACRMKDGVAVTDAGTDAKK